MFESRDEALLPADQSTTARLWDPIFAADKVGEVVTRRASTSRHERS